MLPRQYSREELLGLRHRAINVQLPDMTLKGAVTGPAHPHATGRPIGGESRTLGRFHKFRSYHGHDSGTVRTKPEFSMMPISTDGADYPQPDLHQDIRAETEWRFRGRGNSEAAVMPEPLPAPTGLNAQQSEGFQRFYKAVVSPTHVRVTAGGRVVPNTRGTSPASKRPKEKMEDEAPVPAAHNSEEQRPQMHEPNYLPVPGAKTPVMPMFAYPPHPFYPPFPGHMTGMPVMPMGMGLGLPNGFPYTHQPPQLGSFPNIELSSGAKKENVASDDRRDTSGSKYGTLDNGSRKARRASSSQFDTQKMFGNNGQVAYPFPPGPPPHMSSGQHGPMLPGFLGHPFSMPPFHNPMMGQPPVGMNHILNPAFNFSGMHASMHMPPQGMPSQPPAVPSTQNGSQDVPSAPPVSSIRPSEITSKQIEILKGNLRYHEDQLQYNKHQIDEKDMENTIVMLKSQLGRLEARKEDELKYEDLYYPKKEKTTKPSATHSRISERSSRNTASGQSTIKRASGSSRKSGSLRQKSTLPKKEPCFSLNPVQSPVSITDPVKKSTLPSRAALAPPFEPRITPVINKEVLATERSAFPWDGPVADDGGTGLNANGAKPRSLSKSSDLGKPYLVGRVPPGIDPGKVRDTDYVYDRELTPDENRSRYLYLGKAPAFTRKGLPKFDGKDFYPASPRSSEGSQGQQESHLQTFQASCEQPTNPYLDSSEVQGDSSQGQNGARYSTMFSRVRPKPVKVTLRRPDPDNAPKTQKVNIKSPNSAQPNAGSPSQPSKTASPSEGTRPKFINNVLRRNMSTNVEVLPGALSPATAQGVLPQYATGYESLMAASLSPNGNSLGKPDKSSSIFNSPSPKKTGENCPPAGNGGMTALEQQLKDLYALDAKNSAPRPAQLTGA